MTPTLRTAAAIALALIATAPLAPAPAAAANSGGGDTAATAASAAMAEARAAVDAGRFPEALRLLAEVIGEEPRNADALNLMGYSNRRMNRLAEAARYYDAALKVDPKHVGALEYQGELFVELGDYDRARQNLKLIGAYCGKCEEYHALAAELAAAGQG